jgi:transposase
MPPAAAVVAREIPEPDEALVAMLFPHLARLRIHQVADTGEAVVISASCRAEPAPCPRCGQESSRRHGGYPRVVRDGAAGGRPVLIALRVRRFRCLQPDCPAATFAEQAEGVTSRYCRRSVALTAVLAGFGLELAGRAGARLALLLGIVVHPAAVLRLVKALPVPVPGRAPEVLGTGDFALRKGHVYGTVLVDMTTGDAAGLLPDREAATAGAWLTAHPGAKVICRDRAGAYAEGARAGAPEATQAADRWHLRHNLAGHAGKTVARHHSCLKEPPSGDAPAPAGPAEREAAGPAVPDEPADPVISEGLLVTRTRERCAAVWELPQAGESLHAISRSLSLSYPTVRRFSRAASPDELLGGTGRDSKPAPFKPWICQRQNEGVTSAAALHAELQQRGFAGSVRTVRRYVAPFRQAGAAHDPPPAVPKTRQITGWLLTRPDHLEPEEQARLADIRASCPRTGALTGHIARFAEIMTGRTGDRDLEDWLTAVEADHGQPDLRSFATGIRHDQQAAASGLTLDCNSGKVEGTVNKIKMLKRQMYGRATFDLLRARVILHPA